MWCIVFLIPPPKKNKRKARLLLVLRATGAWWVLGMSYHFLGFLMPDRSLLGVFDRIFSYTIALPCRLGIGLENARVGAFGLARFDLALAMIFGLPFAFMLALCAMATFAAFKKGRAARQRSIDQSM